MARSAISYLPATLTPSFSSLIFAMMPKCPACLVLLLAPLGIKAPGSRWFAAYAILMLAAVPLAFFLAPACRRCGIRPLLLALGGLVIMTIGRIFADSMVIVALGAMTMFGAVLWAARRKGLDKNRVGPATESCGALRSMGSSIASPEFVSLEMHGSAVAAVPYDRPFDYQIERDVIVQKQGPGD